MTSGGPALLDNTVLSNFAQVGRPDLLLLVWQGRGCTTEDALAEFKRGTVGGDRAPDTWQMLPVVRLTDEELVTASGLPARLHPGERTCLAVAVHRRGLFASDDLRARAAAQSLGVEVSGTVGILGVAVRANYISNAEANRLLAEMIAAGYHSPVARLDEVFDGPGEQGAG